MVDSISADALLKQIEQFKAAAELNNAEQAPRDANNDFKEVLGNLIDEVDVAQKQADVSLKQLASGETNNIQDVVMKMEQADLSFKLMLEIRNKLMQAYKDIMSSQA